MKLVTCIAGATAVASANAFFVEGPEMYQHQIELADIGANQTKRSRVSRRVVGGTEVYPKYKYKHVAGLRDTADGRSLCGGSLIANEWVLTAAHCLPFAYVSVNTHSKSGTSDGVQARVLQSVTHPSYVARTSDYDFGLLKIEPIAKASAAPISLAHSDGTDEAVGRQATVIGWGATSERGAASNVLMEVDVDILSNDKCSSMLSGVTDRMICAGGIQGEDGCQGDSGGPFFVSKDSNPILVGVVSWGLGCARAGLPGVYARVSSVRDWIDETTGQTTTWETL